MPLIMQIAIITAPPSMMLLFAFLGGWRRIEVYRDSKRR